VIRTESQTLDVNGLSLHYVARWPDRPADECMTTALLLHGSSGNARIWDTFATALACHMPTLALDLRGHGQSGHAVPPAYRGRDYLADLEQVMDKLEIPRAILVAHSMSVFHSIRYTANNPDRVNRLVLIDIEATCRAEHRDLLNAAGQKPHPVFGSLDQAVSRERRAARYAPDTALASFVGANLKAFELPGAPPESLTYRFDRATLAQFDDYDEWSNLARIKCPALIVYGQESQLTRPDVMQAMKRELNGAQLAEVRRAGHLPMLDNPEGFEEAVLGFCMGEGR
jgi:pimeloyl-ACP methyl ester carboxylesterase